MDVPRKENQKTIKSFNSYVNKKRIIIIKSDNPINFSILLRIKYKIDMIVLIIRKLYRKFSL